MEIKKLKDLFRQWIECTIEEKDISELMLLLGEADAKKQLDALMEDMYEQLKDPLFTKKQKRKIFFNIINRITQEGS